MDTKTDIKNKLKWQCRRGMLELDLWLNTVLDQHFDDLNQEQQRQFVKFLALEDVQCYELLNTPDFNALNNNAAYDADCVQIVSYLRHALNISHSQST
ncbi:MAG: succinate dehydrogenase assembly factor 2 [Gammaproteobacteria bacterium]